ncbi:hypothetical protein [Marilutibacter maris]|uniref:TonB C-terminal domain-containing protein n=1 Tax=Marilutibacter maris TaxID=1605891 RepID=A0A2U9TBD4_9GAMM|nr:hypothetical protein [Lysobacter maris]AWV08675.1 hypothetical protein C9I47_3006 [Lysobacter maris]
MKWHWFALCAALGGAPLVCNADDGATPPDGGDACETAYAALPSGTILDLLDPDAPTERRTAALTAYQRLSAMRECPEFGYTLGQLYRHGSYLPGNPLPQDVEKARELILPMAEAGYLPAFADLAEMEMRHANAREAMKWTQVYLHFVQEVQADYVDDADEKHFQRSAYNSHLLARTELVWRRLTRPAPPRRLIRQDLDAYLAEQGPALPRRIHEDQQGLHRRASAQSSSRIRVTSTPEDCYLTPLDRIGSASASWIVEILPSGEAGRTVLENFVPNTQAAELLQNCLAQYTFAPPANGQAATVRVSMVMGSPGTRGIGRRSRPR